jgi:diguanylate cyclase (GGDEF)-like protein
MRQHKMTNVPTKSSADPLLAAKNHELVEAREHIKRLEAKIKSLEQQMADEQAILTRPEFNREVARMLAFDERYGGTSSVLYFDIVGLNRLGSRFSQELAVETVRTIANVLTAYVRRSDIVGRLGAEEYGVLLVRCDNNAAWRKGRALAAQLAADLETVSGQKLELDISFGAYTFREEEDVAAGLKHAAQTLTKVGKD